MIPFQPHLFSFYVKLEFPAMGTILLIVFKFSISSTTTHFSVSFSELKDRFLAILHVHRFRLSGNSCNFLCFIPTKPPSRCLSFTPVFIHTISLFHFVTHLGINIIKTCYKLCTLYDKLSCIFWLSVITDNKVNKSNMAYIAFYGKFSEQRKYS